MIPVETYTVNPGRSVLINDLGVSPVHVLRRAGLPDDLFSRGPTTLTSEQYFALWRALEDETEDPHLPLRIGRAISVEAFDPPIFAALCSPNLNVAASRIAKYKKLIGPMQLIVAQSELDTTLELRWPRHAAPPVSLSATELVFWVALVRLATRTGVRPVRVTSPDPPDAAEAYQDYLGVRISKDSSYTVCFSARAATRPFLTANEPMWTFFEPGLRKQLGQLQVGSTMADRVRAALLPLLPTGRGTVQAVARELAVSTRTLQRQLKDEQTTFQALLNATREALARHYLADGGMSVAEISFLLGYEEPSSFYRAFQTWTGQTPQRARLTVL